VKGKNILTISNVKNPRIDIRKNKNRMLGIKPKFL
jgi:hypothetical protein|tara:strand:- start:351 stop:455 length:105 start_codon:yes stop_codon:yes gene_type:complete